MTEFIAFPKLSRLSRGCTITEKLDGTNAAVIVEIDEDREGDAYKVSAQSRTRLITPGKLTDNYGFAAWVQENQEELKLLGPGHHYGEWYGADIQRKYGLTERRFALFNPERWPPQRARPSCVSVVPIVHQGEFSTYAINSAMQTLKDHGSLAVPGFMDPEGIVIWHDAARISFKKTFDDKHKEAA